MLKIDRFAYTNALRHVHPGEKMAFALLCMAACLVSAGPLVPLLVLVLMSVAVLLGARVPARVYFKLMLVPCGFVLAGVATVAFNLGQKESACLFRFAAFGLTVGTSYADLYRAGLILAKSLGATSCLYFLALTTPVIEVACFLRKAKLPALWVELFCLTYRFIFVVMETAEKIYLSQSARWGYASLKNSYRSLGQLVSVLLVRSLYRSRALYTALLARGYDGELQVLEEHYEVSRKNWAFITGTGAVLLFLALAGWGWPF